MLADGDALHQPRTAPNLLQLNDNQPLVDTGLGCQPAQAWALDFFLTLEAPYLQPVAVKTSGPAPQMHAGYGITGDGGEITIIPWGRLRTCDRRKRPGFSYGVAARVRNDVLDSAIHLARAVHRTPAQRSLGGHVPTDAGRADVIFPDIGTLAGARWRSSAG